MENRDTGVRYYTTGLYDGTSVVGSEGGTFQIADNYVSKSRLLEGDKMAIRILDDGSLVFKVLSKARFTRALSKVILEGSQYMVEAGEKRYKINRASISFFKLKAGDTVACMIPLATTAKWAAIDSKLPDLE